MKKTLIPVVLVLAVLLVGFLFLSSKTKNSQNISLPSNPEYFWGDGCPHCANVAAFLDSWDKKDKITIDKKEVWSNQVNASLMQQRAKYCNISPSGMGVPFLFTPEGKCLVGDTPIIEYFKNLPL